MLAQDKLENISLAIDKKKKEVRIKRAISKTFVFNPLWKRAQFPCKTTHTDKDILHFYNTQTFDNQRLFGSQIYKQFSDDLNVTHVLAIAPTQSGKTGSMLAIIKEFNDTHASHRVDIQNVFIFTGHSSKEWTTQTKLRFPSHMANRILHRNQLKLFIQQVQDLDNILIIFDESHIANKFGQTLFSLYNSLGFFNIKRLYTKNIKIVHFTATPHSLLQHTHIWQNSLKVVHMQVPDNYVSFQHYLLNNQILPCKPLHGNYEHIRQLKDVIDIHDPFFHIIRTPRGNAHKELIQDFKLVFKQFNFRFISEPFDLKQQDSIDTLLQYKPPVHTFIFIIDKLRCAKSISIKHVQICYDRFVSTPNYDSVLQGLLGRCTGYHTHTSQIRIFTFIQLIHTQHFSAKEFHNILLPT